MVRVEETYFYEVFNINERVKEEILKKYPTIYSAYKILGKKGILLYHGIGSVNNLFFICSELGINFGYCITGKEYFDSFDINKLIREYKNNKKKGNDKSIRSIICNLKKNKKNIKIATLFKISTILNKKISEII